MTKTLPMEAHELLPRHSGAFSDIDSEYFLEDHDYTSPSFGPLQRLYSFSKLYRRQRPRQKYKQLLCWALVTILSAVTFLVLFTVVFLPSYTHLPEHYQVLKRNCQASQIPGRGNVGNEKVFIAATLQDRDGLLLGGEWGAAIVELVQLLGPENVHLSIYENDASNLAQDSLHGLGKHLNCKF
jgi:hypothetical protein